ncbi:MAG: LuxR C-terminal-related transcriptional regulator, partial [Gammaproteobacteria bacterium]|nr:LuxR C-terminal-related transcriptional regulator [Gammaproteobacteria bacterium]
ERLTSVVPGRVLVVEAPAGFGKTQLLRHWLDAEVDRGEVRWLTLEHHDQALPRLTWLLEGALLCEPAQALSVAHCGHLSLEQADDRLRCALLAVSQRMQSLTLVLDQADAITDTQALALLHVLVRALPDNLRLVFSLRGALQIPLHELRLAGRVQRLGVSDLQLTLDETVTLFRLRGVSPHALSVSGIEYAHELAEGWITPLCLIADALAANEPIAGQLSPELPVLADYLATLVAPLSESARSMLGMLARLENWSAPLWRFMFPEAGASHSLERLIALGVPFVRLPGAQAGYHLNNLMRDWLQMDAPEVPPERLREISGWFLQRGDYHQALACALQSADQTLIRQMAEECTESVLMHQDMRTLLRWQRRLPEAVLTSGRLPLVYGWMHAVAGQLGPASRMLGRLEVLDDEDPLHARKLVLSAFVACTQGQAVVAQRDAQEALVRLPEDALPARIMSLLVLSSMAIAGRHYAQARDFNRQATRLARQFGDLGTELLVLYSHARIELAKGYLGHAEQLLRRGLELLMTQGRRVAGIAESRLRSCLALVLWHRGAHDEARQQLIRASTEAYRYRDIGLLLCYSLRALLARDEPLPGHDTLYWVGHTERIMQRWGVDEVLYRPVLEALKVTQWLRQGRPDLAVEALRAASQETYAAELCPILPGMLEVLQIRIDLERGDVPAALAQLACLEQSYKDCPPLAGIALFIPLLQASAYAQAGRRDKALQCMRRALQLAAEECYASPFLELAEGLGDILHQALQGAPASALTTCLLARLSPPSGRSDLSMPQDSEAISEREHGVLVLIAQGMSNQDIADKLHISLHTVKTHARRINAKLGVRSRTQAMVRARELGLL